jgi:hypothetical protein
VIDTERLRSAASRLRKSVGSPVSGSLAYTSLCLVTLLYAVCVERMPDHVLERISRLIGWLG